MRDYIMNERFSRTEVLLGEKSMKRIKNAKIAVFGVGGVGGYSVEALARSGVENITLIDADVVSVSNINRQIIALESTIGKPKVEVAKSRILDINPGANVTCHNFFYTAENADDIPLGDFDYIIDAIDTVTSKIELIKRAKAAGVSIISSMGTGNKIEPTALTVSDISKTSVCPLARVVRTKLRSWFAGILWSRRNSAADSAPFAGGSCLLWYAWRCYAFGR